MTYRVMTKFHSPRHKKAESLVLEPVFCTRSVCCTFILAKNKKPSRRQFDGDIVVDLLLEVI